jgi:hypothetical protein
MKKHLPLDDFEREVQRLADGFEIQPRAMVFEQIRSELAADTHTIGKGKILKGIFSKSLHFISYAAAASVATIGSVLVYQQQESIEQQERILLSFNKVQTTQSLTQRLSNTTDTLLFVTTINEANHPTEVINPTHTEVNPDLSDVSVTSEHSVKIDKMQLSASPEGHASVDRQKNTAIVKVKKHLVLSQRSAAVENKKIASTDTHASQANTSAAVSESKLAENTFHEPASTLVVENRHQNSAENHTSVSENQTAVSNDAIRTSDSITALPALTNDTTTAIILTPDSLLQDTNGLNQKLAARKWLKKGEWSVAGFFSYETNRTELQVPLSSDPGYYYETYRSFMKKTSREGQSFSSGLKVDYTFLNHWGITSGITYAQRKEYLSVDKHHELYYNLVSSSWDVETTTTAGYSEQQTNRFTYLEVPLLLNYINTISGRFAFRLSAGMSYSYLMKQRASFVDMDNRFSIAGPAPVYHQSSRTGETPFRQHNVNMQLGAYVSYLVGQRVEVFVGPSYRRTLMSTFNATYPFRQRFNATGVETGVRLFF